MFQRIMWCCAISLLLRASPSLAATDPGLAAYQHGNYGQAFREFTEAARKGDSNAALNLAVMYERGCGGPADSALFDRYLEQAAAAGHPVA